MPFDVPAISRRAQLAELMDEPCAEAECIRGLVDLTHVNRILLAHRPTIKWLRQFAGKVRRPLKIVDAGCGAGDMLRHIEAWALLRKIPVQLTGVDVNPSALEAARQLSSPASNIQWICSDVLTFEPDTQIDIGTSSLFTHHLSDIEIVRYLLWMERIASLGWFINDLERSLLSYYGFKMLAKLMRWHRFVQHDGPISILRSFTCQDWACYVDRAGIQPQEVKIFRSPIGRICISRIK